MLCNLKFSKDNFRSSPKNTSTHHCFTITRYDAMVLGNHEFDHGPKYIHPFIKKAKFPVLTANVDFTQQPGWPTAPKFHLKSTILKVANVSIGVIGYITPETEWNSSPGPHVKFTPILSAVSREVRYYVYHFFISTIFSSTAALGFQML